MPYLASPFDGAQLFYRDYRPAAAPAPYQPQPGHFESSNITLVFVHGWPLSSRMWMHFMVPLCESYRVRCIAPDRRGFGRSDWCGNGGGDISFEVWAQDTVALLQAAQPPVNDFVFVAASMGCGESLLAWESSSWVRERCKGFIWLGASLPYPMSTPENPQAPSREVWDSILAGFRANRPTFTRAALPGVMGTGEGGPGITLEPELMDYFENIVTEADGLALERTTQINVARNFTPSLEKLAKSSSDVKVLVIHGDSDYGMPTEATAAIVHKILGDKSDLKVYEKAAHGMYLTHREKVLDDVLEFLKTRVGGK